MKTLLPLVAALAFAGEACATAAFETSPSYGPSPTAGAAESGRADGGTRDGSGRGAAAPGSGDGLRLSVHTTLGIPEAASADDPSRYLLVKPQFVASFDSDKKIPRWTSWELTSKWLGSVSRSTTFNEDPSLPSSFPQATNADYLRSGFSRGHICPSADRTGSAADNAATFVFTNIVPQTAESNERPWAGLEEESRDLARSGRHLFIVAGSRSNDGATIGAGVAVPSSMFKVVVILEGDSATPGDVSESTRIIALDIPNTKAVTGSYKNYRTSMGELEAKTGLRFLSDVPPAVHDALAAKVDAD